MQKAATCTDATCLHGIISPMEVLNLECFIPRTSLPQVPNLRNACLFSNGHASLCFISFPPLFSNFQPSLPFPLLVLVQALKALRCFNLFVILLIDKQGLIPTSISYSKSKKHIENPIFLQRLAGVGSHLSPVLVTGCLAACVRDMLHVKESVMAISLLRTQNLKVQRTEMPPVILAMVLLILWHCPLQCSPKLGNSFLLQPWRN